MFQPSKMEGDLLRAYAADAHEQAREAVHYVRLNRERITRQWKHDHLLALQLWEAYLRYTLTSYQSLDGAESLYLAYWRYLGKIK